MPRRRRNPPMVLTLGVGAIATGVLGFLAYKFLYRPAPKLGPDGATVVKAGWLKLHALAPVKGSDGVTRFNPAQTATQWQFYPVGAKVE